MLDTYIDKRKRKKHYKKMIIRAHTIVIVWIIKNARSIIKNNKYKNKTQNVYVVVKNCENKNKSSM